MAQVVAAFTAPNSSAAQFYKHLLTVVLAAMVLAGTAACGGGASGTKEQSVASSNVFEPQIVNGLPIAKDRLPPVNMIVINYEDGGQGTCSSTFLNPTQLITAAHCVDGAEPDEVYVFMDEAGTDIRRSAAVAIHPEYDPYRLAFSDTMPGKQIMPGDIAVVTIGVPYVGPIAAVLSRPVTEGEELVLAGYGIQAPGGIVDGSMHTGTTTVDAVSINQGTIFWLFDEPNESNICNGDSGGPSFVKVGPYLVLTGVHSGVIGGCGPGGLAEDTLLGASQNLNWLLEVTSGDVALL